MRAPTTGEPDPRGRVLLGLARAAVAQALGAPRASPSAPVAEAPAETEAAWLDEPGATFVTLRMAQDGALRGCLGTLTAYRSLREDVRANAVAAASMDPRFAPLRLEEVPSVRFEVSLLGEPTRLEVSEEHDVHARLRPGADGVVLRWRDRRATFLPQVWSQLPDPVRFLDELKRKAGLAPGFWDEDVEVSTYAVSKWDEGADADVGRAAVDGRRPGTRGPR